MRKSVGIGLGLLVTGGTVWAQYLITTVAGGGIPPTASAALTAPLPQSSAVAVDGLGNFYFSAANAVYKVDAAGILTRVAGTSAAGYSGDGGPAANAQLNVAQGVAVDAAGNLYIADSGNSRIRKVGTDGKIATVAGTGVAGYSGNPGQALSAQLRNPRGVALDSAGNIYIADTNNNRVRKVTVATGIIAPLAGTAFVGYSGDGGPAVDAPLTRPSGVAVDAAGNVYIADTKDHAIRKVTLATGLISTVAGTGVAGYSGDAGAAASAQLNTPCRGVLDAGGNLYISDSGNDRIREVVAASGTIITVAGNGAFGYSGDNGAATSAELRSANGVAVDAAGNLYIADTGSNVIRKVSGGNIATVAGNGNRSAGDNGPATGALLGYVDHAALDSAGNLYLADSGNNRVRKVATDGTITTFAGTGTAGYAGDGGAATAAQLDGPGGVAVDSNGNVFIADTNNSVIRKVAAATGFISPVAGNGTLGYSGDGGAATGAELQYPYGVAVDSSGNLYIADTFNVVIRKVATNGNISTVAGTADVPGYTGDGSTATLAELNYPYGVALDSSGTLFIADTGNSAIRRVASGNITTVAGTTTSGYTGDGGAATSATLQNPQGVAVDASGDLFIADTGNDVIREVSSSNISTVANLGRSYGDAGDGGLATNAQFSSPYDVVVDSSGDVYVTDLSVVRMLVPQSGSRALLSVSEVLPASATPGQNGVSFQVQVANNSTAGPTGGTVTVTESFSAGMPLVSMSGTGWNCSGNICTRGDVLSPGAGYPAITVTVNISTNAGPQVSNQAAVSGGNSAATSASGAIAILGASPAAPVLVSPANGSPGAPLAANLSWDAASGSTSSEVYFGTLPTPPLATTTTGTSSAALGLAANTTYYWQIVAQNGFGSTGSGIWSFTTGTAAAALRFVPVTPCRVVDTRRAGGTFGGPTLAARSNRSFPIPSSGCGIPGTAEAYSLNVTVVPAGLLSYLTLWPAGQPQPNVSTLNSFAGTVVANAAIVPAGTNGAVSVYVSDESDVILDIDGYFDASGVANSSSFYAATPCRVADTRGSIGEFGGPALVARLERDFPIPSASCGIPATAKAYSLNVTAIPSTDYLGYLTTWPTGSAQPGVSTLNSWMGKVVANAALVPAGSNGSVSVFVTDAANVVLDINGYFGQPGGAGELTFHPLTPCRVVDTRGAQGAFGGPELAAQTVRSFVLPAGGCSVPSTAAAYSLNVTVVPDGVLPYLTAWPTGATQPLVSALNSFDGG